jgi:hypothetical protein
MRVQRCSGGVPCGKGLLLDMLPSCLLGAWMVLWCPLGAQNVTVQWLPVIECWQLVWHELQPVTYVES